MRSRKQYGAGFLLVLIAALLGAFLAQRAVGQVQLPQLGGLNAVQERLEALNIWALLPLPSVAPRATATPAPTAEGEPAASPPAIATPQPVAAASVEPGTTAETPTPAPQATAAAEAPATPTQPPTATRPADPGLPFAAAGPVRHSSGDCAGASIRGVVRDRAGNPLPGVRLWRYDQWGNEQVVESKSGDADRGAYDFPLGDTPNVHYVQVVDGAGVIASPVVEIAHRQGDAPDAACHWLDWVQR